METTTTTAQARVHEGAKMLDRKVKGWPGMVNLDTLNMHDSDKCVGGQIAIAQGWVSLNDDDPFGEFSTRLLDDFGDDYLGYDYGFDLRYDDSVLWTELQAAWIDEINRRREAQA